LYEPVTRRADVVTSGRGSCDIKLGYEVTMVKDATASYSDEEMHAALDVNIPNYASAVVTTNEVVSISVSLRSRAD
jgi:nicotinamidase-related amidase